VSTRPIFTHISQGILLFAINNTKIKANHNFCHFKKKALRLSTSAQHKTNVGAITNLLSNDVNRFDQNLIFCVFMPLGVIQLVVFSYFLWTEFGIAAMTGVGCIIILMPIQCKKSIA